MTKVEWGISAPQYTCIAADKNVRRVRGERKRSIDVKVDVIRTTEMRVGER